MEDSYEINVKKIAKDSWKFLSQKNVQIAIVTILFLFTLFVGASIRISNLDNLIDPTTGDYTPLALDPYFFLRTSEAMLEGDLPEFDEMRYNSAEVKSGWTSELTPVSTVLIYKTMKIFNSETSLNFANVLNPVIFFVIGIIVFFFLILLLTKDKWLALISSGVLAIIPPYLYRTLAGFSDHESIGMVGFFLALASFAFGMIYLEKKKGKSINSSLLGILAGLLMSFSIVAWTGGVKFLFMSLPLAFLIFWLVKDKKELGLNPILFYGSWILGTILGSYLFGYSLEMLIKGLMISTTGILTFFTLGFIAIDYFLLTKHSNRKLISKYRELFSLGGVLVLGIILYQIFVGNVFELIIFLIEKIINPFGTGRVGLTVAENKQPFLLDWIAQIGTFMFYAFLLGCLIIGGKISSGIKKNKYRLMFLGSFILFILGLLFTRISASSVLNGENFISSTLLFLSFLIFAVTSIYVYLKSDWKIDSKWIIIAAWMIPMILSVRSAIRVFFAIVPFVAFMVPFTLFEVVKFAKRTKDDLMKMGSYILLAILIIGLIVTSFGFYQTVKIQAENQAPSYNTDWQNAMSWVRNNTLEGEKFLHWWDYGYWVQTGGNRPTVTDGGHFIGHWDHLIGRYVLTTPYPETAKSFMKTHNVSYLLIDPTDIGKYGAYSSIGDDNDSSDRASFLPTFVVDKSQTQETRNGTTKVYRGGVYLDSDIIYEENGKKILLPKGKAIVMGIVLEKLGTSYSQPTAIFVYNNNQYRFPLRYLSSEGNLFDFKTGINSTAYIYPNAESGKIEVDGAVMYLSEKTMNSLVVKLYLMKDPNEEYKELELVHEEGQYPFNFYYQGFRGPIRIWKVNLDEMDNILTHEEFLETSGQYGELDEFQFLK